MSIPISQLVRVNPGVLAAAGSAVDLNGLFLTQNAYAPSGQVLQFATAADVSAYFGPSSAEYAASQVYFGGYQNATKAPGRLYFARYADAAIGGFLRSASLATMSLAALQALSGSLTVTINGTVKSAASLSFSGVASFSAAAAAIATALSATCTFDAFKQAFIISSGTTGAASTVTYATGTLATALGLTNAAGATLSQGADAATPGPFMDGVTALTLNWACFSTMWEPVTAVKQAFSDWSNANQPRYAYVGFDSDVNAKTSGSLTTWGAYLKANQVIGSVPVFGNVSHAAFIMGYAASIDFTRLNGRSTLAYRFQSGLPASVDKASDASALKDNGYNWYGDYAASRDGWVFMQPGFVSGEWKWLDTYLNQIWLNANLQLAMVNLLVSVGSVPYNSSGYGLIEAACLDPINAAVNFGAIRIGITLSESQKAQIRYALGFDASQAIQSKGFYLQVADASAAVRVARASPPMTLYYADGGSVQSLTLASIEIQ